MSRACKPTPLKVSRAEMMQEQERHTHTYSPILSHKCMHASPARIPVGTDTHANTQRYMLAHTYAHTYLYAHAHVHACM
jgi:hypothetical protein